MGKKGTGEGECAMLLVLVLHCATNGRTAVPLLTPGELSWEPWGAHCNLAADVRLQALAHHGAFLWKQ